MNVHPSVITVLSDKPDQHSFSALAHRGHASEAADGREYCQKDYRSCRCAQKPEEHLLDRCEKCHDQHIPDGFREYRAASKAHQYPEDHRNQQLDPRVQAGTMELKLNLIDS